MEENNNNEMNKGKEATKKVAKDFGKKIGKNIIKWAWPAISVLLAILFAFGVINLTIYTIQSLLTSLLDVFNTSNDASASVMNQTKSIIYIDGDGAYRFNENFAEILAKELEDKKVSTEAIGLSIDEFGDMIETYIKTEVQTMFPKIGSYAKEGLDGTVIVKRASVDGDIKNATILTYMPYEQFKNSDPSSVINRFSINPENFKICLVASQRYVYANY